jgi:hypothetical protein
MLAQSDDCTPSAAIATEVQKALEVGGHVAKH